MENIKKLKRAVKLKSVEKGKVTLVIDKRIIKQLKIYALNKEYTISAVSSEAITEYLQSH